MVRGRIYVLRKPEDTVSVDSNRDRDVALVRSNPKAAPIPGCQGAVPIIMTLYPSQPVLPCPLLPSEVTGLEL